MESEPSYGTPEFDEYVAQERDRLVEQYGRDNVWNTDELTKEFKVSSFLAPFVFAIRRSDYVKGHMVFQHSPRFYFDWKEDKGR